MKPKPDQLTPDPANPNRMDDVTKAGLARALAEFGDLGSIILNRRTGLLIGGHQRADVLRDGKLEVADLPKPEPDGTVARGHLEHLGRRYAVRVVDWPEDKAHAALLAANKYGRRGQDDAALLKDLLEELDAGHTTDTGQLLADLTGYDAAERERLATQYHVADDAASEPFGDTSIDRDGQGVASTWESCKKTGAAPVRIGPMETRVTVETAKKVADECNRRYEADGTPINVTMEAIFLCGLQS